MSFALAAPLAAATLPIGDLALSRLLLMNDRRTLWLVLAPRREGATEIVDLVESDRIVLMQEIAAVSNFLRARPGVDKINVGALGNIVRQLHIHVVARAVGDFAWPGPVWGAGAAAPYASDQAQALQRELRAALSGA